MANTVYNIAVIGVPRSASKAVTKWYAERLDKQPAYGVLHTPEYFGKNNYDVREVVFGSQHVLHGHWHSLDKLDNDIIQHLKDNYKIVTCYRDIHKVKESIEKITGRNDLFEDLINKSNAEKLKWNIWKHHIIEDDNLYTIDEPPSNQTLV